MHQWLVQICSWCPRWLPLMLMWFFSVSWWKPPTLCMWRFERDVDGRPGRLSSVRICRSVLKYLLIHLSWFHVAWSILRQHAAMYFSRFDSLCQQKAHYSNMNFDRAIAKWNPHTSDFIAPCSVTEWWNTARSYMSVISGVRVVSRLSTFLFFLARNFKFTFRFTLL